MAIGSGWEFDDFVSFQTACAEKEPDVIITSTQCDKKFKEFLNSSHTDEKPSVTVIKGHEFSFEAGQRKLCLLQLPGFPKDISDAERLQRLGTIINISDRHAIRALGGLVSYLLQARIVNELEGDTAKIELIDIKSYFIDEILKLDLNTLSALQIFKLESHPSVQNIGISKEGLSLYGILNVCRTPMGRTQLKEWFLRPMLQQHVLQARYDMVGFLSNAENMGMGHGLSMLLKNISNVPRVLKRINSFQSSPRDWKSLLQACIHAIQIRNWAESAPPNEFALFKQISNKFGACLEKCVRLINGSIDFLLSKTEKRVVVKEGLDEDLDKMREVYNHLGDILTDVVTEESIRYKDLILSELRCQYYPQIGFQIVITITRPLQSDFLAQLKNTDLQYQFHTDEECFFKNPRMVELDDEIGDIYSNIVDIENVVLCELTQCLQEEFESLNEIFKIIAELDCILALSDAARKYCLARPIITEDQSIYITSGRHLLQELCVDRFIPNDTNMAKDREGSIHILTGPNFSGKSIYLKQIGLIVFMAHIGSFVPAEAAKIGLVDRILTRISSDESVSIPESSLVLDLNQMKEILYRSTSKSLVLIDEFGKGTAADDGAALLCSCIEFLLREDARNCPRTIISTHFREVFDENILRANANLSFIHTSFMVEEERSGSSSTTPVFLYKIRAGKEEANSFAGFCATLAGVPVHVVQRAEAIKNLLERNDVVPLSSPGELNQLIDSCAKFLQMLKSFDEQSSDASELIELAARVKI